jgi:hypothetical protein
MIHSKQGVMGRMNEILQHHFYLTLGAHLLDLADRTVARAPQLCGPDANITSPDTMYHRKVNTFLEHKVKSCAMAWHGGSQSDTVRVPPRSEHGINRRHLHDYRSAEHNWSLPVVLSILCIEDGKLLAATLRQLGAPRLSPDPTFDIVNWDVRSFTIIATFDPERLRKLFNSPRHQERWLNEPPSIDDMKHLLTWLGPQQGEFAYFRQHYFDLYVESTWT